jgi:O-antigen/teichoic acid export membrane protein/uncharacterized protein involved in exopolysaccharide biosynthesis
MASEKSAANVILGWRALIYRVTIAAIVVSVALSLMMPNWYSASTTCMPPKEGQSAGSLLSMFTQIGMDFGAGGLLSSTPMTDFMMGILKSRHIRGKVVDRFDLVSVYDAETREHATEDLSDHLVVTTTPEGLIEVSVEDRDPERAAGMANAFMEYLDEFNRQTSVDQAARTREFVEAALEENRVRLEAASSELREFQETHGAIDLSEQTRATVDAIALLEAERTRLELRRGVLEGFSHPDQIEMREIDAELTEISEKLAEFTGRGEGAGVQADDSMFLPLSDIPELALSLADLMREVAVQEKVRAFLSSQLEEARIQETRDLEIIHVLDRATPPLKKSRPRRSLIVLMTVGLAFIGSVGLAFAADGFLRFAEGGGSGSELASSRESRILLGVARWLRNWGGPRGADSTYPDSRMKRSVLHGVAWVGGIMFLVRAVRYLALLVLGGLLEPVEFGVFAALFVVIDGLALLQGFGIGQALIYRKSETDEAADTSFLLSIAIGAALVVASWFLAPVVAEFYRDPSMVPLFRAASLVLVIHGFRLVPFRLLEKALDFRKKLVPAISGSAGYFVVAVLLAARGAGAWSLVWATVASILLETVAYWAVSSWRPSFRFNRRIAIEDLRFGWVVLGGSVLVFAFQNIDRIVLSRVIGTYALGVYAFAFSLANLPATLFVRILNTVLFPSYSSLGDDRAGQRSLFLRATSYMSAAGLLYTVGAVFLGRYFLFSAYGDKWLDAVLPLSILVFFALFRSLAALVGDLLVGTGHPKLFRVLTATQLALAAVGLYFGAKHGGMVGVALVMTGAQVVSLAVGWISAARVVGARAADFGRAVRGPLAAGAITAAATALTVRALPAGGNLAALAAAVVGVAAFYLAAWSAIDSKLRGELTAAVRRARSRGGAEPGGEA